MIATRPWWWSNLANTRTRIADFEIFGGSIKTDTHTHTHTHKYIDCTIPITVCYYYFHSSDIFRDPALTRSFVWFFVWLFPHHLYLQTTPFGCSCHCYRSSLICHGISGCHLLDDIGFDRTTRTMDAIAITRHHDDNIFFVIFVSYHSWLVVGDATSLLFYIGFTIIKEDDSIIINIYLSSSYIYHSGLVQGRSVSRSVGRSDLCNIILYWSHHPLKMKRNEKKRKGKKSSPLS